MQLYCDESVFLPVAFRTPRATNWYFRIFWLLSIVSGITFIHNYSHSHNNENHLFFSAIIATGWCVIQIIRCAQK